MSVNKVSTNQYNPAGQGAYNALMPQMQGTLSDFMQNPLQSNYFNQMFGMGSKQINQQGSSQMQTLMNNMKQFGGGGGNPFMLSQMAQQGRSMSGQKSNLFGGLLQQSIGNRMNAANMASGFKPLQTGGTETTSGLGTWLPQLLGGGISALTGGFGGGGAPSMPAFGSSAGGSSMAAGNQSGPLGMGWGMPQMANNPFSMPS